MNFKEWKRNIPYISRLQFALTVALGCLNIAVCALFLLLTDISPVICAVLFTVAFLCEVALIGYRRSTAANVLPKKSIYEFLSESGNVVFRNSSSPIICFDDAGIVLWYNDAMRALLPEGDNLIGKYEHDIFRNELHTEDFGGRTIELLGRKYRLEAFDVSESTSDGIYMIIMHDVTALADSEKRYSDERAAVAYIAIDNVEDVLQYVHEKFQDAVSKIDDKLKEWAEGLGGIIKSYDNDKYVMLLDSSKLDECIKDRFSILDDIRDTRVGDGVSITVSIGVSRVSGTLAQREISAREAIDIALQRGGDQAVYKTDTTVEYYGGKTKSVYKRSSVRSRVFASRLLSLMARADNVIIMGHRYGDFDSFGASVGVARLAGLCGAKVNIAVDMQDKNLSPCIRLMQEEENYSQVFVDNAEGLDLIGPDTLLVLVDHNSPSRSQFPDIAEKVDNVAVIDHHRKTDKDADASAVDSYIEPSASSACEIVTDMLESTANSQALSKSEADILLAGILLDTKQFTRNTGTRTFGAAEYLRGAGANPADVYALFKTDPADLTKEAHFHTAINIYRGNIAISCYDGETDESYRVIASKAADKMLTLKGIEASFTLVRIGDQIHISGRSTGRINVQLILEKMNGGGHFDVAGAQVVSDSVTDVLETLKKSIDEYLG